MGILNDTITQDAGLCQAETLCLLVQFSSAIHSEYKARQCVFV